MKTDPQILQAAANAKKKTAVARKKTVATTKKKIDSIWANRLALVKKKAENRMKATVEWTVYLKQRMETTARE